MKFTRSAAKPSEGAPEMIDGARCDGFVAPIAMGLASFASAAAPVIGLAASAATLMSATKKPKVGQVATPKVVPLADENSPAARMRLIQTQEQLRGRGGYGSTLVSGQLGDTRAPAASAPLVFGRA